MDLTTVFADHPERLYVDSSCHVQVRGNVIAAHHMFDTMRHDLP